MSISQEYKEKYGENTGKNPKIGIIPGEELQINLKENTPVFSKPYSTPIKLHEELRNEISALLNDGIIK